MSKPLPRSESLEKFCRAFDAEAERSPKKFRRMKRIDAEWWVNPGQNNNFEIEYATKMEELDAIAIHIPTHRIDDFLGIVDEQKYRELEIRDRVPAVKLAYERYKILLKMCGGDSAGY